MLIINHMSRKLIRLTRESSSRLLLLSSSPKVDRRRHISIGVVGAPFWNGQAKPGTDKGPDVLRSYGLLHKLNVLHRDVVDFGNLQPHITPQDLDACPIDHAIQLQNKNEFLLAKICAQLSDSVRTITDKGFVPLTLGGDHSIAIGSVIGSHNAKRYLDKEIALIWIDAHADCNTERSSPSSNLHGMPLSFLIKDFDAPQRHLFQRIKPCLSSHNVVFIGLRDVDKPELESIKQRNIAYFSMRDIDQLGIHEVMARALDIVNPKNENKIHVSFDVDSVDDQLIPSTGTPVLGGLTAREAMCIGEAIHRTGQMIALDVVEFNPQIGTPEQVSRSANHTIDIVLSFFGKSRLGLLNRDMENIESK